ncbi:MAG: hypothetical protein COV52_00855 [Gammaproteobacteria bacterium CG11_big_fil_rev_8_21_14_0_20_46_22]|nr:MAG: hypothetical protein COV52_00855 [Gammaproteobacteria bacterium CG11_big_fil_rev_8_21_14_0_20_46_22]
MNHLKCQIALLILVGFLFASTKVFASNNFIPQLTHYTQKMNQCLSCNKPTYAPINYHIYGNFIFVDGHKLWVEKYGKGSPAVVLLNGGGETIRQWNKIIPVVSRYTTVIGYDRQGLGRSEIIDDKPRTSAAVVKRLRIILKKADVRPPYILVAHSIGGLYASYFARRYPKEIAGLVMVDANNRYQVHLNELNTKGLSEQDKQLLNKIMQDHQHLTQVTQEAKRWLSSQQLSARQHAKLVEDLEVMGKAESANELEKAGKLPNIPLIVLVESETTEGYQLWRRINQQFANEVPCSLYYVVPKSNHHIMISQPLVVDQAIKTVALAVRKHQTLCGQSLFPNNRIRKNVR